MGSSSTPILPELTGDLLGLSELVEPSEIIGKSSPDYVTNAQPWSSAKDKHPRLVLRPKTIESLAKIVTYLGETDLDFKVRSAGFGSSSASDVLISLSAFDDFDFHPEEGYLLLGAGQQWRSYYERLEKASSDRAIVSGRSPSIGVGGSTLAGGYSWLSGEYGIASDPENLLDARIVTVDGQIKWASEDPDLFWAMRGTAGGFAIATHFKFRLHHVPENGKIWGGAIMIPRNSVPAAAKGITTMVEKYNRGALSPKTSMFLYCLKEGVMSYIGVTGDVLVIHAYDGRGEKAGREEFAWALNIDGAVDQTKSNLSLTDIARLQDGADALRGTSEFNWSPIALSNSGENKITYDVIVKSFEWWTSMLEDDTISAQAQLLFELFSCCDPKTGRASTGWPRPQGYNHMLLLGTGCAAGSSKEISDKARDFILEGPEKILGKSMHEVDIVPNGAEPYHDVEKMYGSHYERLRQIKTRVDPQNRIRGLIPPLSQ